jgi:hypothetical protein
MKRIVMVAIVIVLATCTKEEITSRSYPRLRTLSVSNITASGATLHGEITFSPSAEILDHGFVWSNFSILTEYNSEVVSLGTRSGKGSFEAEIDRVMATNNKYYVKAFVRTKDHLVFGDVITFISLGSKSPVIENFEPKQAYWGDTVRISGTHFATGVSNTIRFGSILTTVISGTSEEIRATVPAGLPPGAHTISVEVTGNRSTSTASFQLLLRKPVVSSVSHDTVATGQMVVISGQNFVKGFTVLSLDDMVIPANQLQVTPTSVSFTVPGLLPFGPTSVTVSVFDTKAVFEKGIYKAGPLLKYIAPSAANYGDIISIHGNYFPPDKSLLKVYFDNTIAEIREASLKEIKVKVPAFNERNNPVIKVIAEGETVTINGFTLAAPKILGFIPAQHLKPLDAVTIQGENFDGAMTVRLDGQVISYTLTNKNAIQINLPHSIGKEQLVLSIERMGLSASKELTLMLFTVATGTQFSGNSTSVSTADYGFTGLGSVCCPGYNASVYKFDPANGTITEINNNTVPGRGGPVSFSLPGKVYFGGGTHHLDSRKSDLWEFNISAGTWTRKNDLPAERWAITAGTDENNKVYGLFYTQTGGPRRNELYEYDEPNDAWIKRSELVNDYRYWGVDTNPHPCLTFFIGNSIYILGGKVLDYTVNNTLYKYNIPSGEWKKLNFPVALLKNYYVVKSAGKIFLLNEESGKTVFYEFDTVAEKFVSKFTSATLYVRGAFNINNTTYLVEENRILQFDASK